MRVCEMCTLTKNSMRMKASWQTGSLGFVDVEQSPRCSLSCKHKQEIYPKTINLTSVRPTALLMCSSRPGFVHRQTCNTKAIADPRNIAVIRESGGKMFMSEKKWEAALT